MDSVKIVGPGAAEHFGSPLLCYWKFYPSPSPTYIFVLFNLNYKFLKIKYLLIKNFFCYRPGRF